MRPVKIGVAKKDFMFGYPNVKCFFLVISRKKIYNQRKDQLLNSNHMDLNKVTMSGNVFSMPEIMSAKGKKLAKFTLSVSKTWKYKLTQEVKSATQQFSVVCFSGDICEDIEKTVKQGDPVFIEGQLNTSARERDRGKVEVVVHHLHKIDKIVDKIAAGNFC